MLLYPTAEEKFLEAILLRPIALESSPYAAERDPKADEWSPPALTFRPTATALVEVASDEIPKAKEKPCEAVLK